MGAIYLYKYCECGRYFPLQYYCYEFSDDGDDLHAKRPRQCCPYAVIQFSVTSSQSHHSLPRNVLTQDSSLRNLPSHESRHVSTQLVLSRNEKNNVCTKQIVSDYFGNIVSGVNCQGFFIFAA